MIFIRDIDIIFRGNDIGMAIGIGIGIGIVIGVGVGIGIGMASKDIELFINVGCGGGGGYVCGGGGREGEIIGISIRNDGAIATSTTTIGRVIQ